MHAALHCGTFPERLRKIKNVFLEREVEKESKSLHYTRTVLALIWLANAGKVKNKNAPIKLNISLNSISIRVNVIAEDVSRYFYFHLPKSLKKSKCRKVWKDPLSLSVHTVILKVMV